jgi:hypothetical protein
MNVKSEIQITPEATPLEGGTARVNATIPYLDGLRYCELAGIQNVLPIEEIKRRAASQPFSGLYDDDPVDGRDATDHIDDYRSGFETGEQELSSEE